MNVGVGINSIMSKVFKTTLKFKSESQWRAEARVVSVGGRAMSEVKEQRILERLSENGKKTNTFLQASSLPLLSLSILIASNNCQHQAWTIMKKRSNLDFHLHSSAVWSMGILNFSIGAKFLGKQSGTPRLV